ncbi:hypothetical protein SUGI_0780200 [Cryptomeria japonica]|nr:hypothetical protein SUGI_0780200 [Cryptomeria japonica]
MGIGMFGVGQPWKEWFARQHELKFTKTIALVYAEDITHHDRSSPRQNAKLQKLTGVSRLCWDIPVCYVCKFNTPRSEASQLELWSRLFNPSQSKEELCREAAMSFGHGQYLYSHCLMQAQRGSKVTERHFGRMGNMILHFPSGPQIQHELSIYR